MARCSFIIWVTTSTLFVLSRLSPTLIFINNPALSSSFNSNLPLDPAANSLFAIWCSLGATLALLCSARFRASNGLLILGAFLAIAMWGNFLRERVQMGDLPDYIAAGKSLLTETPLPGRYLYPPLLATLMAGLLQFGEPFAVRVFWGLNLFSVGLFSFLLGKLLERYGFKHIFTSLILLFFLSINTPILRTLIYMQVNLHVINLTLLCFVLYPRFRVFSALSLALAVHLKSSPVVLALPFLVCFDWRWLTSFGISLLGCATITALPFGINPFFNFVQNVRNIYGVNGVIFRENSIDSFIFSTAMFFGLFAQKAALAIKTSKGLVAVLCLLTSYLSIRHRSFLKQSKENDIVFNSLPGLTMMMLLMSPLMWEHHPVFVALPYLLMLKRLTTPTEWALYGFAYFLEFQVPTFDYYPWSFGRLASPLLLLFLMLKTSSLSQDGKFFRVGNNIPGDSEILSSQDTYSKR